MAKYYVSANRGSDTTGVGSAASPWKTIGKAVGPTPAVTLSGTGDVLYIEPGLYRESVTLGPSPTSAGRLTIVGDGDGAGFLSGGYPTPATGLVDWRAWSDDLTPIAGACLTANSKSFVTLRGVKLIGGKSTNNSCILINGGTDWTLLDSEFVAFPGCFAVFQQASGAGPTVCNLTIDRCSFISDGRGLFVNPNKAATEYDMNIVIRNCLFVGGSGVYVQDGGTGVAMPTGVRMQNCTGLFTRLLVLAYSNINIAAPSTVYGCLCCYGISATALQAANTTQMTEDGNVLLVTTPRSNVMAGANSIVQAATALDFGDGRLTGLPLRPFGEPSTVGVIGGWGGYGTPPTVDLAGRNRPEGIGSTKPAAGALERHDTGVKDVTHQDAGSPACMALVGPSSQDRPILVDATSTVVRVKVRWDGNHGDAAKPQAVLLANPEIGVPAQTITATSTGGSGGSPNAYEVLTFSSFTPTAPGVVMLRMVSRSAAGNGAAYFDTITLS